jgi:hypothetical protein
MANKPQYARAVLPGVLAVGEAVINTPLLRHLAGVGLAVANSVAISVPQAVIRIAERASDGF